MRFFVLKTHTDKLSDACTEAAEAPRSKRGDAPSCPTCGATIGMLCWLPPVRVELEARGKRFGDFAFILASDDFLVSERFRDIYEAHQLTGLNGLEPVEVIRVKRKKKTLGNPPKYLKVAVTLSTTKIDLKASEFEFVREPTCPDCLSGIVRRWKRTIVDERTWAGEDIFIPRGLVEFVVTERFKEVCESNDIANAVFVPAEESGHDFYPWEMEEPDSQSQT